MDTKTVVTYLFMFLLSNCHRWEIHGYGYTVKLKEGVKPGFLDQLQQKYLNLKLTHQITPTTYIFDFDGSFEQFQSIFGNMAEEAEPVREYNDTLKPVGVYDMDPTYDYRFQDQHFKSNSRKGVPKDPNIVCDKYYGMGVEAAWRNYTGKGVVIGVTDAGVDIDHDEFKEQVSKTLSFNFIENNDDVKTDIEDFTGNYRVEAKKHTDHGNRVAGIVAARKGNGKCSAGIAHGASLVAMKIYLVKSRDGKPSLDPQHWTSSTVISQAMAYKLNDVDILVNAWGPTKDFDNLDLATRNAIEDGAKNGRNALGRIYVVPSGPAGNGLANSIYTVTVNAVGTHGGVPRPAKIDASVLTSGLRDGNNLTSYSMVTPSHDNKCVSSFKGTSAAVSQVGPIIALALEANPELSYRDVQHLLVTSSDHAGLKTYFKKNAAGHFFHNGLGFGLVNAEMLVLQAKKHTAVAELNSKQIRQINKSIGKDSVMTYMFCHSCGNDNISTCISIMEHALVDLRFEKCSGALSVSVISPLGTKSILLENQHKERTVDSSTLISVHFWDESAIGVWRVTVVQNCQSQGIREMATNVSLTLFGTARHVHNDNVIICDTHLNKAEDSPGTSWKTWKLTDFEIFLIILCCIVAAICLMVYNVCMCKVALYHTVSTKSEPVEVNA